jgi:hypothetical protein
MMRGFCASPSGGTGRRARLKIWCSQGRARSSRAWGTSKLFNKNRLFLVVAGYLASFALYLRVLRGYTLGTN